MPETMHHVTFHFDPACPWTWRTSRWLVDVAERHGLLVQWRAFDLAKGRSLDEVPEQFRAGMAASKLFLRAVESAHEAGDDAATGRAYTTYGAAVHDGRQAPSAELVRQAWSAAAGDTYLAALDQPVFDAKVADARAAAQRLAGDDVGSPVLVLSTTHGERGFFGPVLAPTPTGEEADRLWDVVCTAALVPGFFELKSRRTARP
jgi:hypothetical protein